MRINKLGEFGLIERIKKRFSQDASVVVGPGDDCAVLKLNSSHYQLFTADMLVEGVDFTRHTDMYLVGRKSLAVSVSDIASSGGVPKYAVVSVGLPKDFSVECVDRIVKGIDDLARDHKISIVGGDISSARYLTLNVSMLGIVEKNNLVLRSNARIGDIVFVSGMLGGAIHGKHLSFVPRIKESRFLVRNYKINAMIDISDGLLQDFGHILKASGKGGIIYEQLVPKSTEAKDLKDALCSGEDFELLFTLDRLQARALVLDKRFHFTAIGEIVDKNYGFELIDDKGRSKQNRFRGFQHF